MGQGDPRGRPGSYLLYNTSMNLQTELAPQHKSGLLLRNPVMMAAGTFGYGVEYAKIAEIHRLGAIVCKGTTLLPRSGNEHPRTLETASGLLNAIGLQNPGVRAVLKKYAPIWAAWQTPVIVNIAGETIEEFVEVAERIEGVEGVAGIEVNVSCPNLRAGGAVFGADPQAVADVTAAVRRATTLPIIVKLSPSSGDALEFLMAGASAIQVGTINFVNPRAGVEIVEGIEAFLKREGVASIEEIVGSAL